MNRDLSRDDLLRTFFDLTGHVAIVTGGLGRLGSQYTRTLAHAGAAVAVFDLPGGHSPIVDALMGEGFPVSVHDVDITDAAAVGAAMETATAHWGAGTILVNNAGLGSPPDAPAGDNGRFEDYPESSWDVMLDSHLKGAFLVSQAFIRQFRVAPSNGGRAGCIVNISSTYGIVAPDQSMYDFRRRDGVEYFKPVGYSVAKSGVINFTRWLAEYCAPLNIRVNALVPGGVEEASHVPEFVAEYARRTPLGRMATEEDYNAAILFLASPRATSYMTGSIVVVDGGWTAR
jgi:NAD(P)-dependent dehydrogenase (short-subunit alcohol dehydrogenase family)